jgi:homoserine O-succinyltransferase/O-acetyltransferase
MPVTLEPRRRTPATVPRTMTGRPDREAPIRIGLINNMPDTALQSTEAQFCGLLEGAAATQAVTLRLSSFPELPRGSEALEEIERRYWPIEELLGDSLDALIVTGTEPRAPRLCDEPYWGRFGELLAWAQAHTIASVWSCLAAHAAVEVLDGIQRQRLSQKRSGVYEHSTLGAHPLLQRVAEPLFMPHSRWNELPLGALRDAGYTILSWSATTGADAFLRERGSLLLFFQGHPEYESTTLLKEYRRDVGRYLSGTQAHYPTLPVGYLSPQAMKLTEAFEREALAQRTPQLLEHFPFATLAAALQNTWRPAAVAIYRNWLAFIAERRAAARPREPVSLA